MKRAENQPTSDQHDVLYGGYLLYACGPVPDRFTLLPQHAHAHSHISMVVQGAVRVWSGDKCLGDFTAPTVVKIEAHALHKFLTLTDDVTIACIHNADHADPEGEPSIAAEHQLVED